MDKVVNYKTEQGNQLKIKRFNEGVIKCVRCRKIKPLNDYLEKPENTIVPYSTVCNDCIENSKNKTELKLLQEHEKHKDKWLGYETEIFKVIEFSGYYVKGTEEYPRRWFKYECKFCGKVEEVNVTRLSKLKDMKTCYLCKCSYKKESNLKKCAKCGEWKSMTDENFKIYDSLESHNKRTPNYCIPCHTVERKKIRDKRSKSGKEKEYRQSIQKRVRDRQKERYYDDICFRLKVNVRNAMVLAFKKNGYRKNSKTNKILGCDWDTLKIHIENLFTEGMSWEMMGEHIHIDHIIPLSSAKTEEDVYKLCHYTNIQPLWAKYNLMKNGKILTEEELNVLRSLPKPDDK